MGGLEAVQVQGVYETTAKELVSTSKDKCRYIPLRRLSRLETMPRCPPKREMSIARYHQITVSRQTVRNDGPCFTDDQSLSALYRDVL